MIDPLLFAFTVGMIAILVASYITRWILKRNTGTARMQEVSKYIEVLQKFCVPMDWLQRQHPQIINHPVKGHLPGKYELTRQLL